MELLAMGTKMAISFANIFMTKVETDILSHSVTKPLVWKRFIDDVFLPPLWDVNRKNNNNNKENKRILPFDCNAISTHQCTIAKRHF